MTLEKTLDLFAEGFGNALNLLPHIFPIDFRSFWKILVVNQF
jgi:hypothetical protein